MTDANGRNDVPDSATTARTDPPVQPAKPTPKEPIPKEIGGRGGLDPVRYGDWEKDGRCIDF